MEKIELNVYRGKFQPIVSQNIYCIKLYTNHLEYIYSYNYMDEKGVEHTLNCAILYHKNNIEISMSSFTYEEDDTKERIPAVFIQGAKELEYVYCESPEVAQSVYKKIKTWMIK